MPNKNILLLVFWQSVRQVKPVENINFSYRAGAVERYLWFVYVFILKKINKNDFSTCFLLNITFIKKKSIQSGKSF